MTLQAYIDESFEKNGVFVLGGCIASTESWAAFSTKWEKILPGAKLINKEGQHYFKMSEMALSEERMSLVPGFFWAIEEHVLGFVSVKIDISELKRAQSRIIVPEAINPKIDWGNYANPYYIAFRCLMDKFHIARHEKSKEFEIDEKIDFIFDERSDKNIILSVWEDYLKNRPDEIRKYYGASPVFKDDNEFLPLQAADFYVWWVRKWYVEGTPEKIREYDFGNFTREKGVRRHLLVDITFNEDQLVENFMRIVRNQIGSDYDIYDVKVS